MLWHTKSHIHLQHRLEYTPIRLVMNHYFALRFILVYRDLSTGNRLELSMVSRDFATILIPSLGLETVRGCRLD
jgi:hypothetical protein